MAAVASALAHGYTLAATSTSMLTVVSLTQQLTYGIDSFNPIGNYAADAGMIVVRADAPWKTLDELVAHARQFPGKLTYGSYGAGSLSSMMCVRPGIIRYQPTELQAASVLRPLSRGFGAADELGQ